MTITDIKQISAKKQLIILDETYSFPLYTSEIKKQNFKTGTDISDDDLANIKKNLLFPTALNKSLYLLKTKEYTKNEIKTKLTGGYYPEDIIDSVIAELINSKFLDDKRYAEGYISYHSALKSRVAITSSLMQKGIDKEIIETAFEAFAEENPDYEASLCKNLLERKYSSEAQAPDFETIKKAEMYLARKGFSYSTASNAVKEFFDI